MGLIAFGCSIFGAKGDKKESNELDYDEDGHTKIFYIEAIPNMPNPVTETEVNNFLESKLNMQIGTIDITIEHFSILCLKSGPKILSILIHKPLARDFDRILDLTIL
jgi:hypothetical protein